MFSSFRNRFGIPGVISVIALVFAMFGGAYAANDSGGDATASAKKNNKAKQGKQGKRGKPGKPGATGPAGPAGPAGAKGDTGAQGPQGEKGDKGDKGDTGNNGGPGIAGKSVTGAPIATGGVCGDATGVKYTLNSVATDVCSGEDGETGFTATLPPGATETGTWSLSTPLLPGYFLPISFPIPLAADIGNGHAHFIDEAGSEVIFNFDTEETETVTPTECLGTVSAPSAAPGNLCVYARSLNSAGIISDFIFRPGEAGSAPGAAGKTGAVIPVSLSGSASGWGSWAVSACGDGFPCP